MKKPLGTTISTTLYDALKKYSEKTGIPMTRIVEDALKEYLKAAKK